MTYGIALAEKLLRIVGPGSFLLVGSGYEPLCQALLKCGCVVHTHAVAGAAVRTMATDVRWQALRQSTGGVSTVLLCGEFAQSTPDAAALLGALRPLSQRYMVLAPTPQWRRDGASGAYAWWATAALAQGFRRAPSAFNAYEEKDQSTTVLRDLVVFERMVEGDGCAVDLPAAACPDCLSPRDLTRATGDAADTEAALYAFAAEWVRPGDTVLTLGCRGGGGSALLASQSRAANIVGVDGCATCVAYGNAQFGKRYGVTFHAVPHGPASAFPLADCTIDIITVLGAALTQQAFATLYPEIQRVLKPDGRLLLRQRGVDKAEVLRAEFLPDARYDLQTLTDAQKRAERTAIVRHAPDEPAARAPSSVLVLSRDPLAAAARVKYRHAHFEPSHIAGSHVARFDGYYENPWLYRSMVQMGERIADEQELVALALRTMQSATFGSPDVGAALTVIGYSLLSHRRFEQAGDWFNVTGEYLVQPGANPHVGRWQISLAYCRALLLQAMGERDAARNEFEAVAQMDALAFSPLLCTKVIAAAFWAGIMHLTDGATEIAGQWFRTGVEAGRRALHASDENAIGNPDMPLSFGFQELAEVADMASQCVAALQNMPRYARSPGQFWRQVDVRRFGLASWAKRLEQENQALRQWLQDALRRKAA